MLDPFHLAFVQRGMLEVLLLSTAAGLLGTWIVMRGLAFFTHAVGTAAFPGLVVADGLAISPHLCAAVAAGAFALGVTRLARAPRATYDTVTALVLVAALATGVVLASDVFHSGADVDALLFGSLLAVGRTDLVLAGLVSTGAVVLTATAGPRLLATGFDAGAARAMGLRSRGADAALLALVALTVVASLSAVGALLQTAILVVPAATVRLWTARLGWWRIGAVALAAAEGIAGFWLAVRADTPPGATIATIAGAVFACSAVARHIHAMLPATRAGIPGSGGAAC